VRPRGRPFPVRFISGAPNISRALSLKRKSAHNSGCRRMAASAVNMRCPWGRGGPTYPDGKVPVHHKEYIGWFAGTKDRGQSYMIEVTGLNKKTVQKYKRVYLEGGRQSIGMGRQFDVADSPGKAEEGFFWLCTVLRVNCLSPQLPHPPMAPSPRNDA